MKLTFRFGTFPLWQRQDSKCWSNERKSSSLYDGEPVGIKIFESGKNVAIFMLIYPGRGLLVSSITSS